MLNRYEKFNGQKFNGQMANDKNNSNIYTISYNKPIHFSLEPDVYFMFLEELKSISFSRIIDL